MKEMDDIILTVRSTLANADAHEQQQEEKFADLILKMSQIKREQTEFKTQIKESMDTLKSKTESKFD